MSPEGVAAPGPAAVGDPGGAERGRRGRRRVRRRPEPIGTSPARPWDTASGDRAADVGGVDEVVVLARGCAGAASRRARARPCAPGRRARDAGAPRRRRSRAAASRSCPLLDAPARARLRSRALDRVYASAASDASSTAVPVSHTARADGPGGLDELEGGVHPALVVVGRAVARAARWPTRPGARTASGAVRRRGRRPRRARAGRRRRAGRDHGGGRDSASGTSTHVPIRPDAPVIRAAGGHGCPSGPSPEIRVAGSGHSIADGGVVPAQRAGVLGGVAGADQVGQPGVVLERLVAVGDCRRARAGPRRRPRDSSTAIHWPYVGSSGPEVDEDVEQRAVGDPQRLGLGSRGATW